MEHEFVCQFKNKVVEPTKMCSKIVGQPIEKLHELSINNNLIRLAKNIVSEVGTKLCVV